MREFRGVLLRHKLNDVESFSFHLFDSTTPKMKSLITYAVLHIQGGSNART